MASNGWEFWRVTRVEGDGLEWLAITRPGARGIDRRKVWTLMPNGLWFIANWYLTEDYWREDTASVWAFENIDVEDARQVALEVPQPSPEDMARLTRPETSLTLGQIDRHATDKILGKRASGAIAARR